jgi:16S rRNA (guanine966-N2)-methyltransferase
VNQTVRIIGGKYRGKKLFFPNITGLRPTPDRVKETLFNWLMHDIHGARCLDAFAGSGALGFEAYSRGAARVVFVETSLQAYNNLQQIASSFNDDNLLVVNITAKDYLYQTTECFDLVFFDPPFVENNLPEYMDLLVRSDILPVGGLVYLETPSKLPLDPRFWQERKSKQAGQVIYGLYEKY